jgi:hypothetical protein
MDKAKSNAETRKKSKVKTQSTAQPHPISLKGWQEIAGFLGQPTSVAQRWAKTGMPVTREGRFVTASPEALNQWLGRESGTGPIHVATPQTDLSAELKRWLAYVRREHSTGRKSNTKLWADSEATLATAFRISIWSDSARRFARHTQVSRCISYDGYWRYGLNSEL